MIQIIKHRYRTISFNFPSGGPSPSSPTVSASDVPFADVSSSAPEESTVARIVGPSEVTASSHPDILCVGCRRRRDEAESSRGRESVDHHLGKRPRTDGPSTEGTADPVEPIIHELPDRSYLDIFYLMHPEVATAEGIVADGVDVHEEYPAPVPAEPEVPDLPVDDPEPIAAVPLAQYGPVESGDEGEEEDPVEDSSEEEDPIEDEDEDEDEEVEVVEPDVPDVPVDDGVILEGVPVGFLDQDAPEDGIQWFADDEADSDVPQSTVTGTPTYAPRTPTDDDIYASDGSWGG